MRETEMTQTATLIGDELRDELLADGLTNVAGACQFLGLSRTSVYSLMDSGTLPYVKLGASRRIPRRALYDLAKANLVGGVQ